MRQIVDLENEVKKSNALQKTVHELQEQIAELEKLKSHTDSSTKTSVSEIAELKSQLQASESAKKMFEEELQELRAQQEVAAEDAAAPPAVVASLSKEDREKTLRLEVENKKLQEEVAKLQAQAAASSEKSAPAVDPGLQQRVSELEEQLALKEQENAKISGDKDKLEAYTKRTLAKFQDKYLVALQECKAKLKEKQDKIEVLEQRSQSERTAQKREERLLSSTIYELGLAIMQNRLKSGSAAG